MSALQLVWFKRDLRTVEHRPLVEALKRGPVLPLYVVEPELWQQPDTSERQWLFCRESLLDLQQALSDLGQPLVVRCGDVTRRLKSRNGWAKRWEAQMAEPLSSSPTALPRLDDLDPGAIPDRPHGAMAPDPCPYRQLGGRSQALRECRDFFDRRVERYCSSISSPNRAFTGCSRLSAYLTWGCLSMREVLQQSRTIQGRGVNSFGSRLHWHCHFIQKLEDEPSIEFQDFHPLMRGIRDSNQDHLKAWAEGRTGVPFVDACMRALRAHGWINFRMRAMLMSFASYNLWLPWRQSGLQLARQFVDYEPGIHWSQCQMQSGSTSINTIRIYNPIKQGRDHDPEGRFIRHWCPELREVPAIYIHEPWELGGGMPLPIVDVTASMQQAKDRIWAIRRSAGFDHHADAIQQKHGSRKAGMKPTGTRPTSRRRRKVADADPRLQQLSLEL